MKPDGAAHLSGRVAAAPGRAGVDAACDAADHRTPRCARGQAVALASVRCEFVSLFDSRRLSGRASTGLAALLLCGSCRDRIQRACRDRRPRLTPLARQRHAAVAFDYFVLFNPDSVVAAVDRVFPGKGRAFTDIWRTRQFEYSWLRSMAGRYVDFSSLTEDALVYTANALHIELTASSRRQLMDAYLHLAPWPDAPDTLRRLRQSDIRVITLANISPAMLRANAEHAGLDHALRRPHQHRRESHLQARPQSIPTGCGLPWTRQAGHRLCGVRGMGCRRRQVVRLSDCLGESLQSARRGTGLSARPNRDGSARAP